MQKLGLVQDTLDKKLSSDASVAWTTVHELPLHCSISGDSVPAMYTSPTATQKLVVTQETPFKK